MGNPTFLFYLLSGIGLLLLVLLSAFYSSAEIAFAKCNKLRFEKSAEEGDKTAKLVLKVIDNYSPSLSTILVGNNLVNIATSSLATVMAIFLLGRALGTTMAPILTTIVVLLFGETIPKIIAAAVPDATSRLFVRPLLFFKILFAPIVFLTDKLVTFLSPLWTPKQETPSVTSEELVEILDDAEEEGVFSEDESELIKSAIEFTDTTAKDILVPRVDVFAIDIDEPLTVSSELFKHTRIPVYRENIDNIIGIISTKQLLKTIASEKKVNLEKLMYEPMFVHMTRTISSILEEFRQTHRQMAVVVDEYGGTMGILTLEDITEEIVGEIFDERDPVEIEIKKLGENEYEVDGGMNIYDLFDTIGFEEPSDFESQYTTVGGWATEMLDKFPKIFDSFTYKNLTITVTEAEAVRVNKLLVKVNPIEEQED
ncbi:MAG: HlyC/CorC family transporter [Clostridia bacterium]|nr:HlyC/CorC family transporter [Clostridia bacterium]